MHRIRHWVSFPSDAIRYCVAEAGIGPSDLDVIAINQDAGVNLWKKVAQMIARRPDLVLVLDRIRNTRYRVEALVLADAPHDIRLYHSDDAWENP